MSLSYTIILITLYTNISRSYSWGNFRAETS